MQLMNSRKSVSQYALCSANYTVLQMESNIKSISKIMSAIMENTEYLIVKVCAPGFDQKEGVTIDNAVSLCFVPVNKYSKQRIA